MCITSERLFGVSATLAITAPVWEGWENTRGRAFGTLWSPFGRPRAIAVPCEIRGAHVQHAAAWFLLYITLYPRVLSFERCITLLTLAPWPFNKQQASKQAGAAAFVSMADKGASARIVGAAAGGLIDCRRNQSGTGDVVETLRRNILGVWNCH